MSVELVIPTGRMLDKPGQAKEYITLALQKAGYQTSGWTAKFTEGKKSDHSQPTVSLMGDISSWGLHIKVKPYTTANFAHVYALIPPSGAMILIRKLYDDLVKVLPAVNAELVNKPAQPKPPSTQYIDLTAEARRFTSIKSVTDVEDNVRCVLLAVQEVNANNGYCDNVGLFREEVCRVLGWDDAVMVKLTRLLNDLRPFLVQTGTSYTLTGRGEELIKHFRLQTCEPEPTPEPQQVKDQEPVTMGVENLLTAVKLIQQNRAQRNKLAEEMALWQQELQNLDDAYHSLLQQLSPTDLAFLQRLAAIELPVAVDRT